ncbi:MAG: GNAT family N-acetyltransferase [Terriglobia bacterium]
MAQRDIAAGMRLVKAAGWNQTEADWNRFLKAGSESCFVAESDGEIWGTVATIVYENQLAWIGMVLVSPEHRGKGTGTLLMKRALEHLDSNGALTVKLDATPQGAPLYKRLGFTPEYEIERWVLEGSQRQWHAEPSFVRPEEGGHDLEEIVKLDREAFGAGRGDLLRSLHRDAPELTAAVQTRATLAGYTLGRHGLHADHLGPWMARDQLAASKLLERFVRRSTARRIVVDCIESNLLARSLLQSSGFEYSRRLTRMVRGTNRQPGPSEILCAILGPEFG